MRVFKLNGENIPENPLPSGHEKGRAAEYTMDDLGFFQEIDVPPTLRAVNQDPNLGFLSSIHVLIIVGTQMNADKSGYARFHKIANAFTRLATWAVAIYISFICVDRRKSAS